LGDRCVKTYATPHEEIPLLPIGEPHPAQIQSPPLARMDNLGRGANRVGAQGAPDRDADVSGINIGCAGRNDPHSRVAACQPIGNFIDRSVAAHGYGHIVSCICGPPGQANAIPLLACLKPIHLPTTGLKMLDRCGQMSVEVAGASRRIENNTRFH
jgi:hypothetical protein